MKRKVKYFNEMTPRMKCHARRPFFSEFQPMIEFYFEII